MLRRNLVLSLAKAGHMGGISVMEQSVFIKTTAFGGYDKADVDNAFEMLYSRIYALENKLRENETLLDGLKQGRDDNSLSEENLSEDKKLLAEAKGKCKAFEEKVERLSAELSEKNRMIDELTAKLENCSCELENANKRIEMAGLNGSEALSKVFIEAQKSADMLVNDAKNQAETLKADSLKLTENMIIEANNKAAMIVYNAEKTAAETKARSRKTAEEMKAASSNFKATMLTDIKDISGIVSKIKELFVTLESSGGEILARSENVLKEAEGTLTAGGIPEFISPQTIAPILPEAPKLVKPDRSYSNLENSDTNVDLEKLMDMAMSISDESSAENTSEENSSDGGDIDLDMLTKMAESL